MARDSSPLSKRLKALASRAGLPVESGHTNGTPAPATTSSAPVPTTSSPATPDDEQPTGEFPAVAAADTPDDDRPTGEFPAVDDEPSASPETTAIPAVDATTSPAGAVPPPPRDESASVASPTNDDLPPVVPPIWTDSPAESQSRLTAASTDGPTLPPPTLGKVAPASEPPSETGFEAHRTPEAPSVEEPTALHAVAPATTEPSEPVDAAPPSRAAELHDALSIEPDPASDRADDAPSEAEPPATSDTVASSDEQATLVADALPPTAATPAVEETAGTPVTAEAHESSSDPAAAPDAPETDGATPQLDTPQRQPDRLSLTGRIAALKRRVRPGAPASDGAPVVASTPEPSLDPATAAATTDPQADEEPPPPVTVAEPTPVAVEPPPEEQFAKPSFSERAALRRRVKTLRARRDAGLLELGAITLDQRRFGDPTAGSLLRRRTDELADLDNEIAAIEYALEDHASANVVAALGTIRCLGCGTLVGPLDRYCAHCGTPRPTDAAPSDARADHPS